MELIKKKNINNIWEYGYSVIVVAISVFFIFIAFTRIYFGVDFTDEAFYVASSYYFVLGGRPFVDELNFVMQIPSLIIYPFTKLYVLLSGGTDGIILYLRHVYLIFNMVIALIIFLVLKKKLVWQTALLFSFASVVFVPYSIPNLSYNTLGAGFFLLGLFLSYWVISNDKKPKYMFFSGLSHGLAVASYPTLFVAICVYAVFIRMLSSKAEKALLYYLSGGILIFLLILPVLLNAGLSNLKISYDYVTSIGLQGGGVQKLIKVLNDLWRNFLDKNGLLIVLVAIFAGMKLRKGIFCYLLLFFPLIYLYISVSSSDKNVAMKYVSYYSLMAPYFYLFIKDKKSARHLLYLVWTPSFIAGILTAWTSGDGYLNAALGLLPASMITTIFITLIYLENVSTKKVAGMNHRMQIIPSILIAVLFLLFQYSYVYRDDKILELDTMVSFGPYKGLYTTYEKNKYMEILHNDLRGLGENNKSVLIYDNFPAGYLLTSMKPATSTLWPHSKAGYPKIDGDSTVNYYQRNNIIPDVVVRMNRFPIKISEVSNVDYPEDDSIDQFVEDSGYKEYLSNDNYAIFTIANR